MVFESITPLDVEQVLDEIPDAHPRGIQSQLVIDRTEFQKRIEHKFTFSLGKNKVKRGGLANMVANSKDFNFITPTPVSSDSIWAQNMHLYNSGSLQHIQVPSAGGEMGQLLHAQQQWDEYNVASSLLEFGFPLPPEEAQLVPIRPTASAPENSMCFAVEYPGSGRGLRRPMNTFILARKSLHPLLRDLDFELISPLVSMLWADKTNCGLSSYYHFLGWCNHQQSASTTKYSLSDTRERSKTKTLPGAGMVVLHALILKTLKKPFDEPLFAALESVANTLNPELKADNHKVALLRHLGVTVGAAEGSDQRPATSETTPQSK